MDDKRIVKFSRLTSHQISFRYFYYLICILFLAEIRFYLSSRVDHDSFTRIARYNRITINIYPRSTGFAGNWWLFHRRINFPRIFASRRAVRYTSSVSDNVSPRGNREPPTLGALLQHAVDETHGRPRAAHTYKRTHARGWKFYAYAGRRARNYSYAGRFIAYYEHAHARDISRARGKFLPWNPLYLLPSPLPLDGNPRTRRAYDQGLVEGVVEGSE